MRLFLFYLLTLSDSIFPKMATGIRSFRMWGSSDFKCFQIINSSKSLIMLFLLPTYLKSRKQRSLFFYLKMYLKVQQCRFENLLICCVHIKTIPWKFRFLKTLRYLPVNLVNFLKNRPIFILFYCICMFVSVYSIVFSCQTFHIYHVRISQNVYGVLMWNLRHIVFMWGRRYWEILKSALVYL